jgi:hypothetical protein
MKPSTKKETLVSFNFLRTLADHLESLKPPYAEIQEILIKKIHIDSEGHIKDYEAVIKGAREGRLKAGGSDALQHREDCPWNMM